MACTSCPRPGEPQGCGGRIVRAEVQFDRVWPESLGFPPQLPFLARMIGRSDARALVASLTEGDVRRLLCEDGRSDDRRDSDPMADVLLGLLALLHRATYDQSADHNRCACT